MSHRNTSKHRRHLFDRFNVAELAGLGFSAAEFDRLIITEGNSGELRRAVLCPCVRIDTNTADVSCKSCRGLGRTYPEHLREPMCVLDVERNKTRKLIAAGHLVQGTVQITFPTGYVPGWGDMYLPDGEEHVVTEVLFLQGTVRVFDTQLRIHRVHPDQVKPALLPRQERLLYPTICCMEDVAYKDELGELVHANPHEYHVDNDGRWTWRSGFGPEPGKAWTVRYRAPAVYVVHTAEPIHRSAAGEPMPQRVTMQALQTIAHEDLRQ